MLVDLVSPVTHPPDVDTEVVRVLWGGADGEGMPLVDGDGRYLDEAPVPGAVVKLGRLPDLEGGDPGGEAGPLFYHRHPPAHQPADHSVELLGYEYNGEEDKPLPECWSVEYEEAPVEPVVEVREVEYLEVSTATDETHGADHHEGEDDDEGDPGWVGQTPNQSKQSGTGGQHPVRVGPAGAVTAGLTVSDIDRQGEAGGDGEGLQAAVSGQAVVPGDQLTAGRRVVAQSGPVSPVRSGELEKLDRVRGNIQP